MFCSVSNDLFLRFGLQRYCFFLTYASLLQKKVQTNYWLRNIFAIFAPLVPLVPLLTRVQHLPEEGKAPFAEWDKNAEKVEY